MGLVLNWGIWMMFAVHLFICLVYYCIVRKNTKFQAISECFIVFLIPFFGVLFMMAVKLHRRCLGGSGDVLDVYGQMKSTRVILSGGLQVEADTIPLNDALFIEDTREKRALLTNAIKQNVLNNGQILRKALRDPDREVSHYAVSMLTYQIEKTEAGLFSLERELRAKPGDVMLLSQYRDMMKQYLDIDFLDRVSQRQNEERYVRLLQEMIAAGISDKTLYAEMIDLEMIFGNDEAAEKACHAFAEAFPLAEEQFIAYMSLYWQRKDFLRLQDKIKEMKACPIRLTIRALEIIRFWDQRRKYV